MDNETSKAILELLKIIVAKPDGAIIAAALTVGGMIAVVLLTSISQWIVTKRIILSEHNRLSIQINSEFKLKQFEIWQKDFKEIVSLLLTATDPEIRNPFNRNEIVPLVLKVQLMLNLDNPSHKKVNGLVNNLALAVTGWEYGHDASSILNIHGHLLDASKAILYVPENK